MYPIIIAIHGRGNKLPTTTLSAHWQQALKHGLQRYNQSQLHPQIDFKMAYYADHFYQQPLVLSVTTATAIQQIYTIKQLTTDNHHHYYKQPLITRSASPWITKIAEWIEDKFSVFSFISKPFLKSLLPDIYHYFHDQSYQKAVEQPLVKLLNQYQHRPIILLSHSMGTVIAYNVLHQLSRQTTPPQISTWFTFGSPLGLTSIKGFLPKITHQPSVKKLATPDCVTEQWINVSDKTDIECIDHDLSDDYLANRHQIQPQDYYITNHYPDNSHKSYGYLWSDVIAKYGIPKVTL
ncbi:alpha/beta hydrolase [Photobacterium sp. S4TG1]|uniref:alpha/beta hydrolase n=1 Tax=Photobacterium sp. S4TG1 TaxID=3114587 RepID=UPI002E180705|nr:alpha/beta hydrolase [Photobacterium sp. S4TG1]